MKFVMLAFCVALVGVLGFLVWTQNRDYINEDYTATTVKKPTTSTEENAVAITGDKTEAREGWTRFSDKEIGVEFDYPKSWGWLMLETTSGSDAEEVSEGKAFTITIASTAQRSKTGAARSLPISMGGQSKDLRTSLGRGLGFGDYDAYKQEGEKFSVAHYSWVDGKLGDFIGVPVTSNPSELSTVDGKALVITKGWVTEEGYPYLETSSFGALIPLSSSSSYHAITAVGDSELVSENDFLEFIKSFNLL